MWGVYVRGASCVRPVITVPPFPKAQLQKRSELNWPWDLNEIQVFVSKPVQSEQNVRKNMFCLRDVNSSKPGTNRRKCRQIWIHRGRLCVRIYVWKQCSKNRNVKLNRPGLNEVWLIHSRKNAVLMSLRTIPIAMQFWEGKSCQSNWFHQSGSFFTKFRQSWNSSLFALFSFSISTKLDKLTHREKSQRVPCADLESFWLARSGFKVHWF